MQPLTSYLTKEGRRADLEQTMSDIREFFSKDRRPTIGGVRDPSYFETYEFLQKEDKRGLLRRITDVYFEPKEFEKSCRLYEAVGIRLFRDLAMSTVGHINSAIISRNKAGNYHIGQEDRTVLGLKNFDVWGLRSNETFHLAMGLYMLPDLSLESSSLYMVTFAVNAYCVLLQRYNRARVYNTIEEKVGSFGESTKPEAQTT